MTLKEDLIAYQARWKAVAEIEQEEVITTSIETKWQQLNSLICLAIQLDIFKPDPSEEMVYLRWANLKEKELKDRP
jgi:hypothetical protein